MNTLHLILTAMLIAELSQPAQSQPEPQVLQTRPAAVEEYAPKAVDEEGEIAPAEAQPAPGDWTPIPHEVEPGEQNIAGPDRVY